MLLHHLLCRFLIKYMVDPLGFSGIIILCFTISNTLQTWLLAKFTIIIKINIFNSDTKVKLFTIKGKIGE